MKPPFLQNQFVYGNENSNLAICSRWTQREKAKEALEKVDPKIMEKVAFIGNLYSAQRGIDVMIRNLLAVPTIDTVVLMGRDLSGVTNDIFELFKDETVTKRRLGLRVDGHWTLHDTKITIGTDIPEAILYDLLEKVKLVFVSPDSPEHVVECINTYYGPPAAREAYVIPPKVQKPDLLPGPYSVHPIRAKTIADGYVELLYQILTFGKKVHTHYDQDTLELMDLIVTITEEPGRVTYPLPASLPFDGKHLHDYLAKFMAKEKMPDVSYTYGNRMREHFGVDQITAVVDKLAGESNSRSAVISLWDPKEVGKSSPCLNHLWFRILDDKLFMTAVIRSNDMFFGWPENAYALRYLQETVRGRILSMRGRVMDDQAELSLGDLVIISQSAHVYEDCWEPAKEIVAAHRKPSIWFDEKGQWVFEPREGGKINAKLCQPDGPFVFDETGTPTEIMRTIRDRRLVSDVGHALWLGMQIQSTGNRIPGIIIVGGQEFTAKCPEKCPGQHKMPDQGGLCHRCPIFSCTPTPDGVRLVEPEDYRKDWAKAWKDWFESGMKDYPELQLFPPKE